MTGRKAIAPLSLLCALAFCAFATSSASAAMTAFECEAVAKEKAGFEDPHCIQATTVESKVKYKHTDLGVGVERNVTMTNNETADRTKLRQRSVLDFSFTVGGKVVQAEIGCAELSGTGTLKNEAEKVKGKAKIEFKECQMPFPRDKAGKPACKVKQPIVFSSNIVGWERMGGVDGWKSESDNEKFGEIDIEELSECSIAGTDEVQGLLRLQGRGNNVNGTGTTYEFFTTPASMTIGAGNVFTLAGATTLKKEAGGGIALTTKS